jgi:hypothetical protein
MCPHRFREEWMKHFVEWDSLELRVDGERMAAMVRDSIAGDPSIERIDLRFLNGLLRVEGVVRKYIAVPFTVEIAEMIPKGTEIRVPLRSIMAAGFPLPRMLVGLLQSRFPKDLVRYEEPATLVVSLDRFLPKFVTADIQRVWIVEGGLAVTLGRGGADPPPPELERM